VISSPFSASLLTPRLVAASAVDTGFGVFVAACVPDIGDDVSLVDVAPDAPQADKIMDVMSSRKNIFFMA